MIRLLALISIDLYADQKLTPEAAIKECIGTVYTKYVKNAHKLYVEEGHANTTYKLEVLYLHLELQLFERVQDTTR